MLILPGRFPAQLFLWWNPGWISLKTVVRTTCWIFLRAEWPTHRCWWCRVLEYKMFLSPSFKDLSHIPCRAEVMILVVYVPWRAFLNDRNGEQIKIQIPVIHSQLSGSEWLGKLLLALRWSPPFWTIISYGVLHIKCFFSTVQRRRSQHARTLTPMNTRTQTLLLWAPPKDWTGKSGDFRSHH